MIAIEQEQLSTDTTAINLLDGSIRRRLEEFAESNSEFWSFRTGSSRDYAHAYLQYPGMMVPKMQRVIMSCICETVPTIRRVFDPFVGSGTVMTESMLEGLDFLGYDINPLAVLTCRAKTGPFMDDILNDAASLLSAEIDADMSDDIIAGFPYLDKWFRTDVAIGLSRIRRAIRSQKDLWCRRFFWVALAETVRLSSNSRTSTFKLHKRPVKEISRDISPSDTFNKVVLANLGKLIEMKKSIGDKGLLKDDIYVRDVSVEQMDVMKMGSVIDDGILCDMLVTSPPYGDNVTTVPYGQYSYLPLQWIDLHDIDPSINESIISSTHEIDSRSIGGSRKHALNDVEELRSVSSTLGTTLKELEHEPKDRSIRVAAFCRDLDRSIDPILARLKPNAYMVWTIGNRRVAGRIVPTDDIALELLTARGVILVHRFERIIPSKRMAVKNSVAETMRAETILILRKGGEHD